MTIPNILTLFRIGLIPILVILFFLPYDWTMIASATIFAIGAVTDIFDGYIARSTGQTSDLGAFLDPVADKLMVAVALTILVQIHSNIWMTIPAIVIICREILVSALRERMSTYGTQGKVSVIYIGKVKTTLQMLAIIGLLANPPQPVDILLLTAYVLLYASFFLTLWSLYYYLKLAWPDLIRSK